MDKHKLTMHNHKQMIAICSVCGIFRITKDGLRKNGSQRYRCANARVGKRQHRYKFESGEVVLAGPARKEIIKRFSNCAICNKGLEDSEKNLDHCHSKGRLRGILCRDCNLGLGYFFDDTEKLKSAIKYLELDNDVSVV